MTSFTVVIPVLNQHEATAKYVQSWFDHAKTNFKLLFIDNGSTQRLDQQQFYLDWQREYDVACVRNEENTGVYRTFQQALDYVNSEYIFYSHNDVEIKVYGWDERLKNLLAELELINNKPPGVCGMFGAKGLGTPDIYRSPYNFTQLMRWNCFTVQSMVGAGGQPIRGAYERVITLDGFSLIISRHMINHALKGKFDYERYPPHHNYDNDICLDSHFGGYSNYAIDIDCIHHGGVTSTREKWAEAMGTTDLSIHRRAHEVMYEKFRNRLPVGVK